MNSSINFIKEEPIAAAVERDIQARMQPGAPPINVANQARTGPPRGTRQLESATGMEPEYLRALLGGAVAALRTLFESGCAEANAALALQSQPERITRQRYGLEHRYSAGRPATDRRFISLFISVPAMDGHLFGGAYINTSRTLPSIYLVPHILGGVVCWTANSTGTPFTAQVVRDLFAGVFRDDTAASERLAPLVGYDLFRTPWS